MLEIANISLGYLALITQVVAAVLIGFLIFKKDGPVVEFMRDNYLWVVLLFTGAAIGGSLFYSEIIGFNPCKLCWFQRIFMYPMFVLALVSIVSKEKLAPKYFLSLAIPGILISTYHAFSQLTGADLDCGVIGQSESCGKMWVKQLGYITIPVMAGTCFLMSIIANLFALKKK